MLLSTSVFVPDLNYVHTATQKNMTIVWNAHCNPVLQGLLTDWLRIFKKRGASFAVGRPKHQRRFVASPVYTCFAGVPFVGRGVEGCDAPALVNEEARVMFNL